jgi:hypothetical protein
MTSDTGGISSNCVQPAGTHTRIIQKHSITRTSQTVGSVLTCKALNGTRLATCPISISGIYAVTTAICTKIAIRRTGNTSVIIGTSGTLSQTELAGARKPVIEEPTDTGTKSSGTIISPFEVCTARSALASGHTSRATVGTALASVV